MANRAPHPQIEEGAQVRERQKIFSVIDPNGPKLVNAKVREAQVDKIRHGMNAKIRVDAFPEPVVRRHGRRSLSLARPAGLDPGGGSKVYTTKVKLDNAIPGLRPGMSTQVEFLLANRENALSRAGRGRFVPITTRKAHVAVLESPAARSSCAR